MDQSITKYIFDSWHGSDFINKFMIFISELGHMALIWLLLAFIVATYYIYKKNYKKAVLYSGIFAAIVIMWIFNDFGLKNWVGRERPFVGNYDYTHFLVSNSVELPTDYSFPSGHALAAGTGVSYFSLCNKKHAYWAVPLSLLIAFSRIFLGVHYFSDVIAGLALGVGAGVGFYYGIKLFSEKVIFKNYEIR